MAMAKGLEHVFKVTAKGSGRVLAKSEFPTARLANKWVADVVCQEQKDARQVDRVDVQCYAEKGHNLFVKRFCMTLYVSDWCGWLEIPSVE